MVQIWFRWENLGAESIPCLVIQPYTIIFLKHLQLAPLTHLERRLTTSINVLPGSQPEGFSPRVFLLAFSFLEVHITDIPKSLEYTQVEEKSSCLPLCNRFLVNASMGDKINCDQLCLATLVYLTHPGETGWCTQPPPMHLGHGKGQ